MPQRRQRLQQGLHVGPAGADVLEDLDAKGLSAWVIPVSQERLGRKNLEMLIKLTR
jgi:hypothetical protein